MSIDKTTLDSLGPLIIVDDDPDNGPSVGPAPGMKLDRNLGVQAAVVWSGAWDKMIWDEIVGGITARNIRTVIVLTQPPHHKAWKKLLAGVPLIDIHP